MQTVAGGGFSQFNFMVLNDPFNPKNSGLPYAGINAQYFKELGIMYYQYRCYGSTININWQMNPDNPMAGTVNPDCWVGFAPGTVASSSFIPPTLDDAKVFPNMELAVLKQSSTRSALTQTSHCSIRDYIGGDIENDDEYAGDAPGAGTPTSPSQQLVWNYGCWPSTALGGPLMTQLSVYVDVTYWVEFFGPVRAADYKFKVVKQDDSDEEDNEGVKLLNPMDRLKVEGADTAPLMMDSSFLSKLSRFVDSAKKP